MAKTREIVCKFYESKGVCAKGKEAEFYGICQTCQRYEPLKGSKPARVDNRRRKQARIEKRERWFD